MAYDATTTPATSSAVAISLNGASNFFFGGKNNRASSEATATPTSTATAAAGGSAYSGPAFSNVGGGGKMDTMTIVILVALGYLVFKQANTS